MKPISPQLAAQRFQPHLPAPQECIHPEKRPCHGLNDGFHVCLPDLPTSCVLDLDLGGNAAEDKEERCWGNPLAYGRVH